MTAVKIFYFVDCSEQSGEIHPFCYDNFPSDVEPIFTSTDIFHYTYFVV